MRKRDQVWALEDQGLGGMEIADKLNSDTGVIYPLMRKNFAAYRLVWATKRASDESNAAFGLPGHTQMKIDAARIFLSHNKDLEDFIMAERKFDMVKVMRDGIPRTGVIIRCAKNASPECRKKEEFFTSTGRVSYIHAAQNFRNHGWIVGGGPRADCCDICFSYRAEKKEPKSELIRPIPPAEEVRQEVKQEAKPMPAIAPAAQSKPVDLKDIDRTIRRIIDTKLEEVYNIERGGYLLDDQDKAWSDARLATDLGCDVSWVAAVREFAYGPETSEADTKVEMQKLKDIADEIRSLKKKLDISIERLEQHDHIVNEGLKNFETMTKDFQQRYDRLARRLGL